MKFPKRAVPIFLTSLFVLFFSACNLIVNDEPGEVRVTVLAPAEDSGEYQYDASDIVRVRVDVVYTNGESYFLNGSLGSRMSTGELKNNGDYVVWAYGYDAAGTEIAFSGGSAKTPIRISVDDGAEDVTARLQWGEDVPSLSSRTVRFWDEDAGKRIGNFAHVTKGNAVAEPTKPTKTGYTFRGWYKDRACTVAFDFSQPIDYDITVWSKWEATQTYTVSFSTDGGSAVESQTVEEGGTATEPIAPTKTGYVFAGWYTTDALTQAFAFTTKVTNNITLYAKWTAGTGTAYTVRHYRQPVSLTADTADYELADTQTLLGTTDALTAATAKTYAGFTAQTITQQTIAADGSTVVKIYYDRNTYTVTLDANGGTGGTASVTATYDSALPAITPPTREGYIFVGYYTTNRDTGGTQYYNADGTSTTAYDWTFDRTLYARWTLATATYTVRHLFQKTTGGNAASDYEQNTTDYPDETKSGTTGTLTEASAKTVTGFTAQTVLQKPILLDGSTVVEVYYDRNSITYTFKANDGTWSDGTTVDKTVSGLYGATVTKPANPTRTGYTLRWNATVPATFGVTDATFTASWSPVYYIINYYLDGGTNASANPQTYCITSRTITLANPTKENYNFLGWYTDSSFTNKTTSIEQGSTGYVSLYAKWELATATYTVEHYEQPTSLSTNKADYTLWSTYTQTLTGTVGAQTAAVARNIQAHTAQPFNQETIAADGSTVVKIYYDRNEITVTFKANGGVGADKTQIFYGSAGKKLDANTFTREGYKFEGWAKSADGAKYYNDQGMCTFMKDTTLYAVWTLEAVDLKIGSDINTLLMQVVSRSKATAFKRSSTAPAASDIVGYLDLAETNVPVWASGTEILYYAPDGVKLRLNADSKNMFVQFEKLTVIETDGWDTSSVTNMYQMFYDCRALKTLDVSGFDTSNVTNMGIMFQDCRAIETLDVSKFNTAQVTHMGGMFNRCYALTAIDVSSFNTVNVTTMASMFCDCKALTVIYASASFVTTNVTTGVLMFSGDTLLTGGSGTAYNKNNIDSTYALIDGGTAAPGYFTAK